MPKKVTMEVFRAGTHTDSAGHTKKWTEDDLDKIVNKFNELGEDVPATIGHPESDTAPAFAWFKKVFRKGDTLLAEMSDTVDEFAEMLKKKMFKNRSISLRPDFSLQHIAFLGATPPAVKGLESFAFKANDNLETYEFEEEEKELKQSIKNFVTGLFKEFSKKSTEDNMSKELEQKIADLEKKNTETANAFAEFKKDSEAKEAKFSEDLKKQKDRADKAEAKVAESAKNKIDSEFNEFLDTEIKAGRVLPANKEMFLKTMRTLHGQESMDFNEGDKALKITPLELFKKQISAGGEQVYFGEQFSNGKGPKDAGSQLTEKIREIQKSKKCSHSQAFKEATAENPQLAELYNKSL